MKYICITLLSIVLLSSCTSENSSNTNSPGGENQGNSDIVSLENVGSNDEEDASSEVTAGNGGGNTGEIEEMNGEYTAGSLVLNSFTSMQSITSPYILTGKAPRSWFFEGSFPVTLMTLEEDILHESYASGEWLSPVEGNEELGANDMIDFRAEIIFEIPQNSTGEAKLIFSQDDPSGEGNTEVTEEMVILNDNIDSLDTTLEDIAALGLIGMTELEAQNAASEAGYIFRVVERDGEVLAVTFDYRIGRINASVQDYLVASYSVEGYE